MLLKPAVNSSVACKAVSPPAAKAATALPDPVVATLPVDKSAISVQIEPFQNSVFARAVAPPKNAPPGNVMTPQQMASMGKKDDKPVTVVINIDGREFVKQTVMPALNKEFKLQGIG